MLTGLESANSTVWPQKMLLSQVGAMNSEDAVCIMCLESHVIRILKRCPSTYTSASRDATFHQGMLTLFFHCHGQFVKFWITSMLQKRLIDHQCSSRNVPDFKNWAFENSLWNRKKRNKYVHTNSQPSQSGTSICGTIQYVEPTSIHRPCGHRFSKKIEICTSLYLEPFLDIPTLLPTQKCTYLAV